MLFDFNSNAARDPTFANAILTETQENAIFILNLKIVLGAVAQKELGFLFEHTDCLIFFQPTAIHKCISLTTWILK